MALSIRNLSACILLALGGLTAIIIIYSKGGESGLESPAVGQESSAVTAEKPEATIDQPTAAPEKPDVVDRRAAAEPEKPEVATHGPVLIPLSPPYLNAPIEDEPATPAVAPAEEQAPNHREEAKEAKQDVAEEEQPAEELLALRQEPTEDERSADARQPAEEEPSVEDQPREMESAHAGQPAEEQPAEEAAAPGEEPVEEMLPAEQEQPNETADEGPREVTPHGTLPEVSTPAEPPPKRELTPALAALRDRLRRTVAFHRGQALSATENTATEVMHSCLAFGCNTQIYRSGSPSSGKTGQRVNGITCLCWDYPCGGYELLGLAEGHIAPRIGYGRQEHPSQLLAVLALACVKTTYPMRVGEDVRTVADLVEYEKLSCRLGTDQSLKLIGLTYYMGDEVTWENSLGQQWSVERIIKNELDQPIFGAVCGGTLRLMGLGYALARREKQGQPLEGEYARARRFLDEYQDYALKLQNSDGSWGPRFLAAKGTSRNQASQLRSTGHVLQWLVMSLPEDRLDDPRVVRSVEYVNRLLTGQRYRRNTRSLSTREIGSVMHALHALVVYDERLFQPRTLQPSAAGVKKVAQKPSSS
ncbi:MAG: hypothetical protein ACYSWU_02025 [Planctomycetota bacterium]|jgi:hypothetical protein